MQITYTFRHIEPSDALKQAAQSRLEKLSPFLDSSAEIHVIFDADAGQHKAELNVTAKGLKTAVHEQSDDMYKSIGTATDKLERQLRRNKERRKSHR